ncbi:SBBP repeat-containing protein, partial [Pleurocapsales cyanobacterium LEGE 10410]|nr:SBBP repeat-containing protein [Pleurocapsales cyanobacterium LEGE 10410]
MTNIDNSDLLENDLALAEEESGMLPPLANVQDPGSGFNRLLNNTFGLSPLIPDSLERMLQSLVILEYYGLLVGTPGSDAYLVGRPNKDDTLLTRQGKDILLAVDPAAENPGLGEIDTLVGDLDIFEVFATDDASSIVEPDSRRWQDKFILGDAKQPYYLGSGAKDYASILDFDPELDLIQLHGRPENYLLSESEGNTGIYWYQEGEPELIAILSDVSDLSLNRDYFQFAEDTSEIEPTTTEIEQLGSPGVDLSVGIASDDAGGIYLTGPSEDSFWVTKYNNDGEQQWLEQPPSTGNIDTDSLGNVYVGGGLGDIEISKYNSDGVLQWTQFLGTFSLDNSFNLEVDDAGNVYLVGYTLDDLGGENAGDLTAGSMPIVSTDAWIAKYDTDGNQQWVKQFGSNNYDEAFAIVTDRDSNVYTSGWTLGDLGGENTGVYDVWVAKNDANGDQQWIDQFGTSDYDWSWDAAVDGEDNLYLTGWTLGDLGGENAGSYDGWVAKYNPDGDRQWIKQFGTEGDDTARSIDFDEQGNFYLTGSTDADFGGENAGSYDTWVAKYDSNGNQQWKQQFGTSGTDNPFELVVDNTGEVLVTGFTEGSLGS